MATTEKRVSAREIARKRVAAQREAQRRRDKDNETDLAAALAAADAVAAAEAVRDKAILAARSKCDDKIAGAHARMGAALAAIRDRGETVATLAELSDLTDGEVRRLIKLHTDTAPTPAGHDSSGAAEVSAPPADPQPSAPQASGSDTPPSGDHGQGPASLAS
ncbi:hypothetical protein [Gordonia rubripertincta]|uniref:Uncharacterized protein n=1 Tax=Gordonia rubripertincta TaxID=36822 RepID=A0ABT4N2Z8_GORRU|nr:hypothetical protein [Gordonia rubripertincta]MCZ4553653.1 hypothetical protein [Gordonia rubripertincta]